MYVSRPTLAVIYAAVVRVLYFQVLFGCILFSDMLVSWFGD
jgi:hypothetical protein